MMQKIDNLSKRTEETFRNHLEILSSLSMEEKNLSSLVYSHITPTQSPIENSSVFILPPTQDSALKLQLTNSFVSSDRFF